MNRSLANVGVAVVVSGFALVASPIVLTGHMLVTIEMLAGLVVAPLGVAVVGIAAAEYDPRRTTVQGTFGQEPPIPAFPEPATLPLAATRPANPKAPVRCPNCRTMMTYDLARCPRCAEDRPCRECGRPLTAVEEQATCPGCTRPELFCHCSQYGVPMRKIGVGRTAFAR